MDEINQRLDRIEMFINSLKSESEIDPFVARVIKLAVDQALSDASINDFSDVTISSPSSGQVLKYSGGKWVNGTDDIGAM